MSRRPLPIGRRVRQHGAVLHDTDRRDLERDGWRTTLEYRENHRRARDGRLLQVTAVWHAEAERGRTGRDVAEPAEFISASAGTAEAVWSRLRLEAELIEVRSVERRPRPTPADSARVADQDVREQAELVLARGGRH